MLSKARIAELKRSPSLRQQYIQSLLEEDNTASVTDLARRCAADGIRMRLHEITPLRAAARRNTAPSVIPSVIPASTPVPTSTLTPAPLPEYIPIPLPPFTPILFPELPADQLSQETLPPMENSTEVKETTMTKLETPPKEVAYAALNMRQKAERKRLWAIDWLWANKSGTVNELQDAIIEHFGQAIRADDARKLWHEAREVPYRKTKTPGPHKKKQEKQEKSTGGRRGPYKKKPLPPAEPKKPEETRYLVTQDAHGGYFEEAPQSQVQGVVESMVRRGIPVADIRVWKQVTVNVAVVQSVELKFGE